MYGRSGIEYLFATAVSNKADEDDDDDEVQISISLDCMMHLFDLYTFLN